MSKYTTREAFYAVLQAIFVENGTGNLSPTNIMQSIKDAYDSNDAKLTYRFCEHFDLLEATSASVFFDIASLVDASGSVAVDAGSSALVFTTDITNGNKAGIQSFAASFLRANNLRFKTKFKISVAWDEHILIFGLYQDADNYAYFETGSDKSDDLYFRIKKTGTSQQYINLGSAISDTYITLELYFETDGTPHVLVNDVEIILTGITDVINALGYYFRYYLQTGESAEKVAYVDYIEIERDI